MRILFDAHQLGRRQTGNETYVRELLDVLPRDTTLEIFAAVESHAIGTELEARGVQPRRVPRNGLLRLGAISMLGRRLKANVIHTIYYLPPYPSAPTVVTIHDVSFEIFPEYFSRLAVLRNRLLVRHAARHASVVVTVSEAARRDIIRCYGVDPDRVVAIPNGVGAAFFAASTPVSRPPRSPFRILAVGTLQPRKNILRIAAAVRMVAQKVPVTLRVIGPGGYQADLIREALGQMPTVEISGYVTDGELAAAYREADLFVYPSLYEGFGLPVLEAMASGVPVVTSRGGALEEVAGDAAFLVDPISVEDMAGGIERLATESGLRTELIGRGLKRAALFSWESAAQKLADVYRRAAAAMDPKETFDD